uniref:Uncharacterized protein n=1 Tax=Octopus bimaculoides TaxID=37653 RepID=A0A0L8HG45_OCTBM
MLLHLVKYLQPYWRTQSTTPGQISVIGVNSQQGSKGSSPYKTVGCLHFSILSRHKQEPDLYIRPIVSGIEVPFYEISWLLSRISLLY